MSGQVEKSSLSLTGWNPVEVGGEYQKHKQSLYMDIS